MKWIKQHKIIFLAFIILIVYFSFLAFQQINKSTQQQSPQKGIWQGIDPGITTESEVIAKLGTPVKTEKLESKTFLSFTSTSPTRLHQIEVADEKAQFIKEIVSINDTKNMTYLIGLYGNPEYKLYSFEPGEKIRDSAEDPYNLFVTPSKGIAYLANEPTADVLEIWYFPPTTLEEFMTKWAPNYTPTPPPTPNPEL